MVTSQVGQVLLALPFAWLRARLDREIKQRKILPPRFRGRELARVAGAVNQLGFVPPPVLLVGLSVQFLIEFHAAILF